MININRKPVIKHGFEHPHGINYYQITASILYLISQILGFCCTFKLQILQDVILIALLQVIFFMLILLYWYLTTRCDPTDKQIQTQRIFQKQNKQFKTHLQSYCTVCQAHVQESSKHCSICNRCTDKFDHHCVWLNNCIGYENYQLFFLLLTFVNIQLGITTLVSILTVLESQIFGMISLTLGLFLLLPLLYLQLMHIYFQLRGITTYDYIMVNRNKRKHAQLPNTTQDISQMNQQTTTIMKTQLCKEEEEQVKPAPRVNWDQEEADIQNQGSFHAKSPMKIQNDSNKTSHRQVEGLTSGRTAPQTKRQLATLIGHSQHKQLKSLINFNEIKNYYKENMVAIDEQSIIKINTGETQITAEQFQTQVEQIQSREE